MNTWLAGVAGLAMTAFAGNAIAQEAGTPPAGTAQVEAPAPVDQPAAVDPSAASAQDPAAPPVEAAETPAAPGASDTVAAAWEGEIPAAYLGTRTPTPTPALEAFLEQPRLFLDENPEGGEGMVRSVRSLLGTDNRTVAALVNMVKLPDVRDAQVGAVAEGLAGAMRDAEAEAPRYSAYIQWAVAQSDSKELIAAFERASGADEDRTAAIGAGARAPGAPGSGSLAGGGAPGPSGSPGTTATVATSGGAIFGSGGSISFNEGDSLLGATGRTFLCAADASPAGCQIVP